MSGNVQLQAVLAALTEDTSPNPATTFFPSYSPSSDQPNKVKLQTIVNAVLQEIEEGNPVSWGDIDGTLSEQTDLLDALNTKAPTVSPSLTGTPTAPTAAQGTNTQQLATTAFVNTEILARIASLDVLVYKGAINCSSNPNYPAADAGHNYRVSVAGKIGGGSGVNVEIGDLLICHTDASSTGNHATVGANWDVIQVNLDGVVTINRTISAGVGLSGGGDLSANRTFALDINGLTEETTADDAHFIAVHTSSGIRKISRANFLDGIGGGASSPLALEANNATEIPFSIKLASGQSVPSFEIKDSGNTVKSFFRNDGFFQSTSIFTQSIENIAPNALSLTSGAGIILSASNQALSMRYNGAERIVSDGGGIGFWGGASITKPTASGSRGGNAALASLLTALANYGLIIDSTTA